MAFFKNNPFPGVNTAEYQNWQKVVSPDGQVYYVVPGNSGFVYDPVLSNATGKQMFHPNPQRQYQDAADAKAAADAQRKQQAYAASPLGQIVPAALGIGGLIAANKLGAFGTAADAASKTDVANALIAAQNGGASSVANAAAQGATGAANAANTSAAGAAGAANAGSSAVNGATPSLGYAPYLGLAGAGLGAYELYNGVKSGSFGQGALGGAGIGAGLAEAAPLLGLSATGVGLPVVIGAAALGALGGGGLAKLFHHETTRELAKKHTNDLKGQAPDDQQWQGYVSSMRDQYDAAPPDPSKPFHGGQYATWEDYKTAGLDANDLTGVYGNLKTYGPKWSKLSFDQQKAVTQANINDGLYDSQKGEVVINDQDKALANMDRVLGGQVQPNNQKPSAPAVVAPTAAPGATVAVPQTGPAFVMPPPGTNPDPGFTLANSMAQGATKPIVRPLRG